MNLLLWIAIRIARNALYELGYLVVILSLSILLWSFGLNFRRTCSLTVATIFLGAACTSRFPWTWFLFRFVFDRFCKECLPVKCFIQGWGKR